MLVLALANVGCGGGSSDANQPQAALATTLQAQREFRAIQERWLDEGEGKRGQLAPDLRQFLRQYPQEPKSRLARAYLAWLMVEQGQLGEARGLVAEVRRGRGGRAMDLAVVIDAAIWVRQGDPERALRLLEPLVDKLVDAEERLLLGEQRVRAAISARRYEHAVEYIVGWLASALPEDRERVQLQASSWLARIESSALERALASLRRQTGEFGESPRAPIREWVERAIVERLVREALAHDDVRLARRLMDSGARFVRRGASAAELSRLAARGEVRPRVLGRQVGLVLSTGKAESARRSAEIALGMTRALGLPVAAEDPEAVRLVTADDAGGDGELSSALSRLAGEGATVLVAGSDGASAAAASRYAEHASIPVIVLSGLEPSERDFTFVLGVGLRQQREALLQAVKGTPSAVVGPTGVACDRDAKQAGQSRFPVQEWKRDGIGALLLLGDSRCARDVVKESRAAGFSPSFGFALESATMFHERNVPTRRMALAAGVYPAPPKEGALGAGPSWFASLGHDAAVLAARAVANQPLERVDDRDAVRQLHRVAKERLARAEAELWTSASAGFAGGRELPRTLTVRQP